MTATTVDCPAVAPPKKKGGRVTPRAGAADPRKVPTAGTPQVARVQSSRSAASDGSVAASSRYTPPVPAKVKGPSPVWIPVLLFGLLIVGALLIMLNYMQLLPGAPKNLYLLLGLGSILGGIMVATQYR
jgi:Cell division protein CrgA